MCNLYRMKSSSGEVAALFGAEATPGANFAEEVYPGYPGMVVADGVARTMTWGFPLRLKTMKPTSKPKAVNNARDDKLHTAMWKASFENRRCLIPVSAWSEAEGEPGKMTRTWYSLPNTELFAVAGIWRQTVEWGDAYSMVMTGGCQQMAEVHDRMPIILSPDECEQWTRGSPAEAMELVRTYDCPLVCERTDVPWFKPRAKAPPASSLL